MPTISRYFDQDLDMWIPSALVRYWPTAPTTIADVTRLARAIRIERVACGYRITEGK